MTPKTKTKTKKAGMVRTIAKPLGSATRSVAENYGKDYLQKKSVKVLEGIYNEPSLAKDPKFLITGQKDISSLPRENRFLIDKENIPYLANKKTYPLANKPIYPLNKQHIQNYSLNYDEILGGRTKRKYRKRKKSRKKSRKNRK